MAFSKIIFNGETQMDVTQNTVASGNLLANEIATGADGEQVVGAYAVPTGTKQITENGTGIDVAAFEFADVNVAGGGITERKQVAFFDYDGTITNTYTKEEFAALSALPANPSHTGLTAQGWNWTLTDGKTYLTNNPDADLNIGQMYVTTSGATEIDVTLDAHTLAPYLIIAVNGEVEIDWGDNSTPDTVTGTSLTSNKSTQHTYSAPGNYTIKIKVNSGSFTSNNTAGNASLLSYTYNLSTNRQYPSKIKAIRLGTGITQTGDIKYLNFVEYITIPSSVTNIGSFINNYSLKSLTIPSGVTEIKNSAFNNDVSLKSVVIPSSTTTIHAAFSSCDNLESITIPSGASIVDNACFAYCRNLRPVILPSSITVIAHTCFRENSCIESYEIKNGVTETKQGAFRSCLLMKEVTMPNTLTTIGQETFYDCWNLQSVTIPSSVTSIGSSAFQNCTGVSEYHFKPTTPPTLAASNVFNGGSQGTTFYVPTGYLSAYTSATNYPSTSNVNYVEE